MGQAKTKLVYTYIQQYPSTSKYNKFLQSNKQVISRTVFTSNIFIEAKLINSWQPSIKA